MDPLSLNLCNSNTSLFVCLQDYGKTTGLIFIKLGGKRVARAKEELSELNAKHLKIQ